MEDEFEQFWKVKPKRKGSNPKDLARIKFIRAVASGIEPQKIVAAAQAWAKQERDNEKDGTEYVAMAVTWLNQKRFNDFAEIPLSETQAEIERTCNAKGWFWIDGRWQNKGVGYVPDSTETNTIERSAASHSAEA